GLTPGLGDREIRAEQGSARHASARPIWDRCSNDAPSNGIPDSLAPRHRESPGTMSGPRAGGSRVWVGATPSCVPWLTVRCARGPPAGAIGQGRSLVLQRSYVKGVLQAYVRAVNAVSPICQIVRAANDKSTVAADAGRLTGRSAQPASPRGSARL